MFLVATTKISEDASTSRRSTILTETQEALHSNGIYRARAASSYLGYTCGVGSGKNALEQLIFTCNGNRIAMIIYGLSQLVAGYEYITLILAFSYTF